MSKKKKKSCSKMPNSNLGDCIFGYSILNSSIIENYSVQNVLQYNVGLETLTQNANTLAQKKEKHNIPIEKYCSQKKSQQK